MGVLRKYLFSPPVTDPVPCVLCIPRSAAVCLPKVDINGDGMMEWDEFTRFVVVKAQLHHAQMSIDQLAEYRQGSRQVRE